MAGLPGARLDELREKSDLIANNCPRGRDGFDSAQACLYPLYKPSREKISESDWTYPIAKSDYGFHRKP